ncbi:MAG: N-acetylmuramoyl-L-alanine amidase [Ignavibacteriaceae bacterium]
MPNRNRGILTYLCVFLLLVSRGLYSQPDASGVELSLDNNTQKISAFQKGGITYISVKELAKSYNIGYFVNSETQKIEMKFERHTLKITAKNPFLVLHTKGNNSSKTLQLPLSSLVKNNEIYIPLEYSKEVLNLCFGKELIVKTKNVTVQKEEEVPQTEIKKESSTGLNLVIDEKTNGTLLTLKGGVKLGKYSHSLKKDLIQITFKKVEVNPELLKHNAPKGLVKEVKVESEKDESTLSIIVDENLSSYEVINSGSDILVTMHNKKFQNKNKEKNNDKDKWFFDVIVLDAGHGGKDPGAIGVNKLKEKDINLALTLKIGNLLKQNMPEVKVVYTRSTDKFIELYKRGKIANENNGKLFISIHCNSVAKKNTKPNGFEVYLLRPGRTEDAIAIAEFENSVIQYEDDQKRYQKLTDENFILVTMAHSSYMRYSEKFAEIMDNHVRQGVDIASKGVKQAGFYVLVGASMPSVLVEAGFLSNPKDAAFLNSNEGQNQLAEAIFKSIKSFKIYYDSIIENE